MKPFSTPKRNVHQMDWRSLGTTEHHWHRNQAEAAFQLSGQVSFDFIYLLPLAKNTLKIFLFNDWTTQVQTW